MDLTYDEYLEYLNHLFLERLVDFAYHFGHNGSTVDSLTVL